ncbi:MAG: GMC family oxidoreductase N-terminal domain-containing protein [Desulfosudis oleivorans]|nr:GMC family oxidoreductase N-terminal domain-containing protein [Desulfosudis oleivorans]
MKDGKDGSVSSPHLSSRFYRQGGFQRLEVCALQVSDRAGLKVFLAVANRIVPPDGSDSEPEHGHRRHRGLGVGAMEPRPPFPAPPPVRRGRAARHPVRRQALHLEQRRRPGLPAPLDGKLPHPGDAPGLLRSQDLRLHGLRHREDVWKSIGYDGPIHPEIPYPDAVIRGLSQGRLEVVPLRREYDVASCVQWSAAARWPTGSSRWPRPAQNRHPRNRPALHRGIFHPARDRDDRAAVVRRAWPTADGAITVAAGKAVGGSTVMYTGVTFRIPDNVVRDWKVPGLTPKT